MCTISSLLLANVSAYSTHGMLHSAIVVSNLASEEWTICEHDARVLLARQALTAHYAIITRSHIHYYPSTMQHTPLELIACWILSRQNIAYRINGAAMQPKIFNWWKLWNCFQNKKKAFSLGTSSLDHGYASNFHPLLHISAITELRVIVVLIYLMTLFVTNPITH